MYNTTKDVDLNKEVTWYEWKTISEMRHKQGPARKQDFKVKITKKTEVSGSIEQLCDELEAAMCPKGSRRLYTIDHQYSTLRQMKKNMGSNEITLHIDFAENYCCKLASEVQSIHFGASRNQVTMHNVVAYTPAGTVFFYLIRFYAPRSCCNLVILTTHFELFAGAFPCSEHHQISQ
jgi:hypothetical protein